jgi:hypothetical protein
MLLQQLDTGFTNQLVGATSAQILETDVATASAVTETGSILARLCDAIGVNSITVATTGEMRPVT